MAKFLKNTPVEAVEHTGEPVTLATAWGPQVAEAGDWIITNPDGERYPCPRQTFLTTYVTA